MTTDIHTADTGVYPTRVSLRDAAIMTALTPKVRFFWRGERGTGKSAGLQIMRKMLPSDYLVGYIDCTTKDLGDLAFPFVDAENRLTYMAPAAGFHLAHNSQRPVLLCLDEYPKGTPAVRNALHTLLEVNEPRFYDIPLPEGSIIYLTGNLAEEGLGDTMPGHTLDRVTEIEIAKPGADEWIPWAAQNNINPAMIGFVYNTPQVLASFRDPGQENNQYIMHPNRQQRQVFTPRGAERASHILDQRHNYPSEDALRLALAGTIGTPAAYDLMTFLKVQDQLPTHEAIISDPAGVPIPSNGGAQAVIVHRALTQVTPHTLDLFMEYLMRMSKEWQAVFVLTLTSSEPGNEARKAMGFGSAKVTEWLLRNVDVL